MKMKQKLDYLYVVLHAYGMVILVVLYVPIMSTIHSWKLTLLTLTVWLHVLKCLSCIHIKTFMFYLHCCESYSWFMEHL